MNENRKFGILEHIESILLLGGDDIRIKDLSKFFSISADKILQLLEELRKSRFDSGINISIDQEVVRLVSNPRCGEVVNLFFQQDTKPRKLSNAALETLSIIAYRQPITRAEIEIIRGVAVDGIVHNLEQRNFIRICGKKDAIGKPKLYEITDKFLSYLGVATVEELPQYESLKEKLNAANSDK